MTRSVFFDGERLPDDGHEYVRVPKSDPNRFWKATLFNRRRGVDRVKVGTFGVWRLRRALDAIKKRYPDACKSGPKKLPMVVRTRRAGPIILQLEPLTGPSVSAATKQ